MNLHKWYGQNRSALWLLEDGLRRNGRMRVISGMRSARVCWSAPILVKAHTLAADYVERFDYI
jgi:hypothetical protein